MADSRRPTLLVGKITGDLETKGLKSTTTVVPDHFGVWREKRSADPMRLELGVTGPPDSEIEKPVAMLA